MRLLIEIKDYEGSSEHAIYIIKQLLDEYQVRAKELSDTEVVLELPTTLEPGDEVMYDGEKHVIEDVITYGVWTGISWDNEVIIILENEKEVNSYDVEKI